MKIDVTAEKVESLTNEDYSKAMNFIGQNLLSALVQSLEKLPPPLRDSNVISQALSAFLSNIIYKQFPDSPEACQKMLEAISKLVSKQLDKMSQPAK
ncbi:hypothetical protein OQJ18_10215 [Fluoribacter dumoffii]|uniref:Uncharacterized protein n=1 Tax=Fluoribacter dumoffii TaxID=463 RepID=A0A377G7C3_9GAMM|nr:hypothetical protein [Fluoribacter dumoffii]KTC92390.1 hypothetical protein Ldum_0196 [Fluoribacter dumoffii NY 23]MCW8386968.1 hypothetical protein [Fluoribacter dumoffii]MCW8417529.1 hypothetical protein [Fluoribacter dumoffii]MCW8454629.1 hypothetical protein [Fluoribacter dumoffii]MCW8461294.1 hypothetical protein [Fluoribacter dumoffii]